MSGDRTLQIDRTDVQEHLDQAHVKQACFVIIGGLDVGRTIRISEPTIVVGRDEDCDVVLRDDGISRRHAEIVRAGPDSVMIRDLGSTNGTFVAGQRISQTILRGGDKVLLGRRTILKFELQDMVEQSYQEQLYESSTRDGLTGVFNRKYFMQRISSELSFSRRHKLPISVVMYDLDHFKKVNDTYGHQTGDQILLSVTQAVLDTVRMEDVVARYGGEEFFVIAQGIDIEGGIALAERVRQRVASERTRTLDGTDAAVQVTVSLGVCTVPVGMEADAESIIAVADGNLYKAKRRGRNQVVASKLG